MRLPYLIKIALRDCYKPVLFTLAKRNDTFLSMLPFRPASGKIIVTDNCNSRCITCSQWKNNSTNELTSKEICDTLTQLRELGVIHLQFTGGEPLLRHDLPRLVERAAKLRFQSIGILTNGLLLTESRAKKLLDSGLTSVGISVDGLRETHEYVRGVKSSFDKTIAALEMLSHLGEQSYPHLKVTITTTLTRPTLNQVLPVTNLTSTYQKTARFRISLLSTTPYLFQGVDTSSLIIEDQKKLDEVVHQLHNIKTEKPGVFVWNQTHQSLEYIKRYYTDSRRTDIPCVMGYSSIYVRAHGEIHHGCWAIKPVGNVREKKLVDIVNSVEYRKRLKDMFYKRCLGCACGYQVNLLYHLPTILGEIPWIIKSKVKILRSAIGT
ncbi:radical SAM/SPASM domain-containing protein [Chloroflexota bacterium]